MKNKMKRLKKVVNEDGFVILADKSGDLYMIHIDNITPSMDTTKAFKVSDFDAEHIAHILKY